MSFLKLFALIVFVGLASCKTAADAEKSVGGQASTPVLESKKSETVEAAGNYKKDGVYFILRKNWKVTEDEEMGGGVRYINVEDDNNAVVALTFIPTGTKPDLKKYAADFMSTLRTGLAGGNLIENGETVITRNAANVEKKGISRKYTVTAGGEKTEQTAELFLIGGLKYDCVVIYTAPDDEKSTADAGFETILYTISAK